MPFLIISSSHLFSSSFFSLLSSLISSLKTRTQVPKSLPLFLPSDFYCFVSDSWVCFYFLSQRSDDMMHPVQEHVYGYDNLESTAFLPAYNTNSTMNELMMLSKTTPFSSESGLTYNNAPRKRSRVESNPNPNLYPYPASQPDNSLSFQIQQHQSDIDRLISHHMEKVRGEIEEKRRIVETIEMGMMKRLRAKEAEVEQIGKLNWALEEKVKSLCVENHIWRDLAHSNEATANALRTNLEQLLKYEQPRQNDVVFGELNDDAESCCGGEERRRWCRNCGKEGSCVLLLPCRHLCLCTVCGSTLRTCPVCKSTNNASVHVNLS